METIVDGGGFEPGAVPPGRLGQQSMRERTERVGGTIEIRGAPVQGTAAPVAVPAEG